MSVVKIKSGVVVHTWQDVETVADAVEKYGLDPADLIQADHPPGTIYDGSSFSPPPPPPPPDFAAIDAAAVDRLLLESGVMRALAKALFQVVNNVRVLKGDSTITAAQFKNYLKGLIR